VMECSQLPQSDDCVYSVTFSLALVTAG
jgi:hypothetical protein